jgi:hypothetical protein
MDFPLAEGDANSNYVYGASVVTPWISMGFLDVSKRLMVLKLYTESMLASLPSHQERIQVYYQLESGTLDTGWTSLSTIYETSPFQSSAVDSDYSIAGRRVRFKFFFQNLDPTVTMKLRAWILGAILTLDVRNIYNITVRIDDNPEDLRGMKAKGTRAEDIQARLDTWSASPPIVLTMTTIYSTLTNKTVIVVPFPIKPYKIVTKDKQEASVANIQLMEVA